MKIVLNQINACWVEAVRKENKGRILKEDFDFNPKHRKFIFIYMPNRYESFLTISHFIVIAITEKPTRVGGAAA